VILSVIGIDGCAVTQTISVQTLDIDAPVAAPPIRVVDNAQAGQIIFSPHLSWPSTRNITGILEYDDGYTDHPVTHRINNFTWTAPTMGGGMDIDVIMSPHTALEGGFTLSGINGRTYGSWSAGFGFFNQRENEAVRFDIGIQSTPVMYTSVTRIINTYANDRSDTSYYYDNGEESAPTIFAGLTMNTTRKTWLFNLFLNAYVTKERFIDFVPGSGNDRLLYSDNGRASASQWIVGLTPGIFIPLMEDVRLVIGERVVFPFNIANQDPFPLLQLHAQLDIIM
jgi:hypothetical protein